MNTKLIFRLGSLVITENVMSSVEPMAIHEAILKHASGNWGDVSDDDKEDNEIALLRGLKLFSVHRDATGTELRIVTAADRSSTTVFLPYDYNMLGSSPPAPAQACWDDYIDHTEFSNTASSLHPNDVDAAVLLHTRTGRVEANKHLSFNDITEVARGCHAASLCRDRNGNEFVVYTRKAGEPPRVVLLEEEEAKRVYQPIEDDVF